MPGVLMSVDCIRHGCIFYTLRGLTLYDLKREKI